MSILVDYMKTMEVEGKLAAFDECWNPRISSSCTASRCSGSCTWKVLALGFKKVLLHQHIRVVVLSQPTRRLRFWNTAALDTHWKIQIRWQIKRRINVSLSYMIWKLPAGEENHLGVNEVIEIGAYKVNQLGEVLDVFNKFIKPTVNPILSDFCRQLTSISQSDVDKSKTFPHIIQEFQDWINVQEELTFAPGVSLTSSCSKMTASSTSWSTTGWTTTSMSRANTTKSRENTTHHLQNTIKHEGMEFTGITTTGPFVMQKTWPKSLSSTSICGSIDDFGSFTVSKVTFIAFFRRFIVISPTRAGTNCHSVGLIF